MMYRLLLALPFDVSLVYAWGFTNPQAATGYTERLPTGFSVVLDESVGKRAITIPFKHDGRPPVIDEYEKVSQSPLIVGDVVYVTSHRKRGRLIELSEDTGVVSIEGKSVSARLLEIARVPIDTPDLSMYNKPGGNNNEQKT